CYASEYIISVLNRIKPPYNVNQLTQLKALERLNKVDEVKEEVNTILQEREVLATALNDLQFIKTIFRSDANFILARVDDANKRYNELINKGIVVRNRTMQPLCEECLRFTIGTKKENEELINALKELQ
ncbi:MAG: aminotransferase class I/II-fold pyridoxal phosphate-dependent enzyme, partial [Bacteroidota bacterium]